MFLRNSLLQLIVAAVVVLTARSLPTPNPPTQQPSGSSSRPNQWMKGWTDADLTKAATLWRDDQLRQNLVDHKDWINILSQPEGTCPGMNQNDLYFRKEGISEIQKLFLIKDGAARGLNSEGIYNVTEEFHLPGEPKPFQGKGAYLLKKVDIKSSNKGPLASCEPYALKQFDIWHRTGIRTDPSEFGAILLKRERGEEVAKNDLWKAGSQKQKQSVLSKVQAASAHRVYKLSFQTSTNSARLLPTDLNSGNHIVWITQNGKDELIAQEVNLIDFGYPGILTWKEKPSWETFLKWFTRRFKLAWADQYYMAGDRRLQSEFLEYMGQHYAEMRKGIDSLSH
ncbi:hypothetical protein EV360DRAFT_75237 [Lentinula raphanica]|nr:hypothetical protein EV360DRAFT_75237 [Lentinula raphanica]